MGVTQTETLTTKWDDMTDQETTEFKAGQSDSEPDAGTVLLPMLPLTQGVVFPQMVVTIALETDEAKRAGAAAEKAGRRLVLVPRVDGRYATVGTIAQIENAGELPNGTLALVIRGVGRGGVGTGSVGNEGALHVAVEPVEDPEPTERARELAKEYRAVVETILEHRGARRIGDILAGVDTPGQLADMAAYAPDLDLEQRVELLESVDVEARLHLALSWARETLAELELKDRIRTEVTDGIDAQQREMLLRRQMDAIRKELGESDDDAAAEYRARANALELPDAVRTAVDKELDKFERMGAQNPEQAWVRNWLDAVLDLPWGTYVTEDADLGAARAVLDADHDGLDDVKERILEFLAVRVLRRERGLGTAASGRGSGAILGLVGPPGVGKTSLGESVAARVGPAVRAHRRGRCARRSRDPWAPSDLRRCARRAHRPCLDRGEGDEPRRADRRGRQVAGRWLERRSVVGAARGLGPRAEPHLP